jgi:RNA polymerase sigma-70 factor (ECF subfamily)
MDHGAEKLVAERLTRESWLAATDGELLHAISEGLSDAFDEFFTRYAHRTYSLLNRLTAGRADPEDLLQETFLRVIQHAGDFREDAPFWPWLFTIARNVAYNTMEYAKRRNALEVKIDPTDLNPMAREHRSSDPSTIAENDELKRLLPRALDQLPVYHREILVLIFFEGLSYEEASKITGDPSGTLRSRTFHALKRLREIFKGNPGKRRRTIGKGRRRSDGDLRRVSCGRGRVPGSIPQLRAVAVHESLQR